MIVKKKKKNDRHEINKNIIIIKINYDFYFTYKNKVKSFKTK